MNLSERYPTSRRICTCKAHQGPRWLWIGDFHRSADALQSWCKTCQAKSVRKKPATKPMFRASTKKAHGVRNSLSQAERRRMDRTIRELRARGLSYAAIAVVLELYEGQPLMTADQVRSWGNRIGVPKDLKKSDRMIRRNK